VTFFFSFLLFPIPHPFQTPNLPRVLPDFLKHPCPDGNMTSKHRSTPYLHGLSSRGSGAIASFNFGSLYAPGPFGGQMA
jgi:hypothetical protein